jgi:hypothetical protein
VPIIQLYVPFSYVSVRLGVGLYLMDRPAGHTELKIHYKKVFILHFLQVRLSLFDDVSVSDE